jgi:hypothetical protein
MQGTATGTAPSPAGRRSSRAERMARRHRVGVAGLSSGAEQVQPDASAAPVSAGWPVSDRAVAHHTIVATRTRFTGLL